MAVEIAPEYVYTGPIVLSDLDASAKRVHVLTVLILNFIVIFSVVMVIHLVVLISWAAWLAKKHEMKIIDHMPCHCAAPRIRPSKDKEMLKSSGRESGWGKSPPPSPAPSPPPPPEPPRSLPPLPPPPRSKASKPASGDEAPALAIPAPAAPLAPEKSQPPRPPPKPPPPTPHQPLKPVKALCVSVDNAQRSMSITVDADSPSPRSAPVLSLPSASRRAQTVSAEASSDEEAIMSSAAPADPSPRSDLKGVLSRGAAPAMAESARKPPLLKASLRKALITQTMSASRRAPPQLNSSPPGSDPSSLNSSPPARNSVKAPLTTAAAQAREASFQRMSASNMHSQQGSGRILLASSASCGSSPHQTPEVSRQTSRDDIGMLPPPPPSRNPSGLIDLAQAKPDSPGPITLSRQSSARSDHDTERSYPLNKGLASMASMLQGMPEDGESIHKKELVARSVVSILKAVGEQEGEAMNKKQLVARISEAPPEQVVIDPRPPSPQPSETSSWNSLDEDPQTLAGILRDLVAYVPDFAYWPNLEVLIMILFAPGVSYAAVQVISDPNQTDRGHKALAVTVLGFGGFFMIHEALRLALFSHRYRNLLWDPTEKVETDDPMMRLLVRARVVRPGPRFTGGWAIPLADADEPYRSMRAFWSPLAPWWLRRGGDMYASLSWSWLNGACGSRNLGYQYIRLLMQIIYAVIAGIGVHDGNTVSVCFLLLALQMGMAFYSIWFAPAVDRLEALTDGFANILGGVHILLRYISWLSGNMSVMIAAVIILAVSTSLYVWFMLYSVITASIKHVRYRKKRAAAREKRLQFWEQRGREQEMRRKAEKYLLSLDPSTATPDEMEAAMQIQARQRGKELRKKLPDLQDELRDEKVRRREVKEGKAATVINKNARARMSRQMMEKNRQELMEQRNALLKRKEEERIAVERYRKEAIERDLAATRLTAEVRAQQARVKVRQKRREIASAIAVQAVVRGFLFRMGKIREELLEQRKVMASLLINQHMRRFIRHQRHLREQRERAAREKEMKRQATSARRREKREAQSRAATTIIAASRGWRQRYHLKKRKEEDAAQAKAQTRETEGNPRASPSLDLEVHDHLRTSLRVAFNMIDKNADGKLSRRELMQALAANKHLRETLQVEKISDAREFDALYRSMDEDDSRSVEFSEFEAFFVKRLAQVAFSEQSMDPAIQEASEPVAMKEDEVQGKAMEAEAREKAALAAEARAKMASTRGQLGPTPKIKPRASDGSTTSRTTPSEIDFASKSAWE